MSSHTALPLQSFGTSDGYRNGAAESRGAPANSRCPASPLRKETRKRRSLLRAMLRPLRKDVVPDTDSDSSNETAIVVVNSRFFFCQTRTFLFVFGICELCTTIIVSSFMTYVIIDNREEMQEIVEDSDFQLLEDKSPHSSTVTPQHGPAPEKRTTIKDKSKVAIALFIVLWLMVPCNVLLIVAAKNNSPSQLRCYIILNTLLIIILWAVLSAHLAVDLAEHEEFRRRVGHNDKKIADVRTKMTIILSVVVFITSFVAAAVGDVAAWTYYTDLRAHGIK